MKNYIFLIILFTGFIIFQTSRTYGQGDALCAGASPFCTGTTYNFPLNTGTSSQSGPDYGCLGSQPNPVWYYLQIDQSGDITVFMQSTPGVYDVDFICWGPFTSATSACTAGLTSGNTIDCSYSTSDQEECNISNALSGEYYMLLITNYSNQPTNVAFSQTNAGQSGAGTTDCSVMTPCNINAATATPGACAPTTNQYSVTGTITFVNPPASGTLIVTDGTGISQTLSAPFTSPMSYTLSGLTSDGAAHTVHIAFSADPFCTYDMTYTAPAPCNACVADAGPPQTVCGLSTTMAAVTQTGDYNYSWSYTGGVPGVSAANPSSPTTIVSVATAGTYYFTWTVTNANGVTCTDDVSIKFSEIPTSTFNFTPINCFDNNSTTLTFTGSAGATSVYNWDFGGGTAVPGGTTVGPHTVTWTNAGNHVINLTVVDGSCFSLPTTHTLNTPPELITDVSTVPASCSGNNGTVIVNVSGGVSGYTYNYSNCNCPTSPTTAGSYTVTITDANGCTDVDAFVITQPDPLTVTQVHTNLQCYNDGSGTAGVSVVGGTAPYTYSWSNNPGLDASNQTGLQAGNYTVSITDANTCLVTTTIGITQPPQLTASILNTTDANCFGESNGTATATGSGGTSPIIYNWGTTTSPLITTLNAGSHIVTVTDVNGCTATATAVINEPTQLTATITAFTNVSCFGGSNGTATVTAGGGSPSYQYNWTGGNVSQNITGLAATTYTASITDAHSCVTTTTVTITQPDALGALVINSTDATCFDLCDGTAEVSAVGGTSPYSWNWSGSIGTSNIVSGLCFGTHNVTLTDANNCTSSTTVQIYQPPQVTATISSTTMVSCFNGNDGSATVTPDGGVSGYTYTWSTNPQQTNATATGLSAGNYIVTVTDSQNCSNTTNVTITQPDQLVGTITITSDFNGYEISCFGEDDGILDLLVSGGTIPYNYNWSNTQTNQDLVNITAGTFSVVITDANGCLANTSATLTEPPQLIVLINDISNYNGFGITCAGVDNGFINISVSGGNNPLSYLWSNSDTSQNLTNIEAGSYSLTVSSANGCTSSVDTILTAPPALTSSVSGTNVLCNGNATGAASLSVSGGVEPYMFLWSNAATTQNINNITAGLYYVSITDANNCTKTDSIVISQPTSIQLSTTPNQLTCSGVQTTISAIASGGAGNFIFVWNTGQSTSSIIVSPTLNTTYHVYAIDANGCYSDTGHIIINVMPPLSLTLYAEDDSICEGSHANINALISGGTGGPYSLYDQNNTFINNLPHQVFPNQTTQYVFTARDICGTTAKDTIMIYVLPKPEVIFTADIRKGCKPLTVSFVEQINAPGASYQWNFEDNNSTSQAHYPVHTFNSDGVHSITLDVTSADGCTNTKTIADMIFVYPLPDPRFTMDPEYISILKPVVTFTNFSFGASSYLWSFGDTDSSDAVNPVHYYKKLGTYNVDLIAITNRGCKDTVSARIIVHDEYSFYAPSAFSPDHNTLNDVFTVVGRGINPSKFNMTVYDRWGQLIYETTDLLKGWDGNHLYGGACPNGIYTWMVVYTDLSNVVHHKSGPITLIR